MISSRDDFGIAIRSALLQRGAKQRFSLFFRISISLIIFFLDYNNFKIIELTKKILNDAVYRVSKVATAPAYIFRDLKEGTGKIIFTYKENESLKEELEELRNKNFQVEYLENQNKSLRKTIEKDQKISGKSTLAKVLLDRDSPYLKTIIINRGSKSEIKKGMPVVDGNYLVGKIVEVNYLSSRVLLLNDLNSRVPVTFGDKTYQAILTGTGDKNPKLDYLPENFEQANDITVFTSGKDGIFSAGIPVGKTKIKDNKIEVKLYSDPNQLSFVTVQLLKLMKETN